MTQTILLPDAGATTLTLLPQGEGMIVTLLLQEQDTTVTLLLPEEDILISFIPSLVPKLSIAPGAIFIGFIPALGGSILFRAVPFIAYRPKTTLRPTLTYVR